MTNGTKNFFPMDNRTWFDDKQTEQLRLKLLERVRFNVESSVPVEKLIPGLHLSCVKESQNVSNCFYVLTVGLILQGTKHLTIGGKDYLYGAGTMLTTSIDIPTSYELIGVTPESPFISLSLRLSPALLAEILSEETPQDRASHEIFQLSQATHEMFEDFEKLLRLLSRPEQIATRAPMIIRDIHYLALSGTSGECLRTLYTPGAAGMRIRKAIRWLRDNFRENIAMEKLAAVADMAPTTFYRHFKSFTSLSPLQYQKRLRLYEAQQFLLRGEGDVNSAAYSVGYQSPQQFNRDYKALFGTTPGRGAKQAKEALLRSV